MEPIRPAASQTRFAATLAGVLGIDPPALAEPGIDEVRDRLKGLARVGIDRILIHNPDAVARWLWQAHPDRFAPIAAHTRVTVPFHAAFPPITPVCFATLYTGTPPEVHGSDRDRHAVVTDSLFDALARAGRRAAIVAVEGSSMARIFAGRPIDYFTVPYDREAAEVALALMESDRHDFIAVYTQEYDDVMHKTGPESPEALAALGRQTAIFHGLAEAAETLWTRHDTLVGFCTDHGVHAVPDGGSHGLDIPEDIEILHVFDVIPRSA